MWHLIHGIFPRWYKRTCCYLERQTCPASQQVLQDEERFGHPRQHSHAPGRCALYDYLLETMLMANIGDQIRSRTSSSMVLLLAFVYHIILMLRCIMTLSRTGLAIHPGDRQPLLERPSESAYR